MRRSPRTAVLCSVVCGAAAATALLFGSVAGRTQADPASRAIHFLQSHQSPVDGSIPAKSSTYAVSELYAIASAAAGYDPNAMRDGAGPSVMQYLAGHASAACATAGQCGELIQAVVAAGLDPRAFAGDDLLTLLNAQLDAATGRYGDGHAFTQALAVQGLVAARAAVPRAAIAYIEGAQDTDGGWDWLDVKDDPNPNDFAMSDTNSTAMSLMALDGAGDHARDASGLAWLRPQQDADGGFPYQVGAGAVSDPDSAALVLQSLVAAGQDPNSPLWTVSGHTAASYLMGAQAGDGGYAYPGSRPNAFTTSQVPLALLQQPLPAFGSYIAGYTPAVETAEARHAISYLRAQLSQADGSFPQLPGTYDSLDLLVIGAAASGVDPTLLHGRSGPSAVAYLEGHASDACSTAGRCGRLIQAALAAGLDPHAFGGLDLVRNLLATYNSVTGRFGDGEAFTQAIALQALSSVACSAPRAAITFLEQAQDSDGGWDYLDVKDDPNSNDFATSDTNSTAMALMALDAVGVHDLDASGLRWLRAQQDSDGGFPYQAGSGTDADSTALVLQAVVAGGQDPAGSSWTSHGRTAISYLAASQDPDGGWSAPGGHGSDVFTTAQVPVALARAPFPPSTVGQATLGGRSSPCASGTAAAALPLATGQPAPAASTRFPQPAPRAATAAVASTPAPASPPPPAASRTAAPRAQPPVASAPRLVSAVAWPVYAAIGVLAALLVAGGGLVLARRR